MSEKGTERSKENTDRQTDRQYLTPFSVAKTGAHLSCPIIMEI
jgi:hypothetical protein